MCFPLLTGCFGVYAEVAATTYPSATVSPSGGGTGVSTSASSIGFNVGADFGNTSKRFALGYESQSISVDKDASASLGASSARLDFNVLSVSDRAKVRLGGAFEFASGSSKAAGMTKNDASGGGAYAGVGLTYFPTWHVGLHALAGAAYGGAQLPSGNLSGTGATFRLAVTYQFSDLRPNPSHFYPLERNTDITGLIDTGARAMGCATQHQSHTADGYAWVNVDCSGEKVSFFQIESGMMLRCEHMFDGECEGLGNRIVESSQKQLAKTTTRTDAQQQADAAVRSMKCIEDYDAPGCERVCNESHIPEACEEAARLYTEGHGVTADPARAEKLYAQACDAGSGSGCFRLGWSQATRNGTQDMTPAISAMTKACDLGYGDGCAALGGAYLVGQGVPQDDVAATKLLQRGCDASSPAACRGLADSYANGLGVTRDLLRAAQLMKKACDMHDAGACKTIANPPPASGSAAATSQEAAQPESKPAEGLTPPR